MRKLAAGLQRKQKRLLEVLLLGPPSYFIVAPPTYMRHFGVTLSHKRRLCPPTFKCINAQLELPQDDVHSSG